MKLRSLVIAALLLVGCGSQDRGPRWVSVEDPYGISFSYVEYGGAQIFSIGCSEGKAHVSIAAQNPSTETSEVVVHLAGADRRFAIVNRDLPGVVAEAPLSDSWIDAVARAETISVNLAGQAGGTFELPANIRTQYAERCREVLTNPRQFP